VNTDVSSAILGFSRLEQIEENMKALELAKKWNADLEEKVEALFGNLPNPGVDFKDFKQYMPRRKVALMKNE